MKCPNCGGKGKYKNVFGKVDGCYYCLGTGNVNDKGERVKTEQEYIQNCNTEQLVEEIYECVMTHPWHISKAVILEWLKQPHK